MQAAFSKTNEILIDKNTDILKLNEL